MVQQWRENAASIFLVSYLAMAGGEFLRFSRDDAKTAFLELLVWMVTYAYRLEACGGNDNDTGGCVDTPPLPANRSEKRPPTLARTNWISSFPIQPTVNSNDSPRGGGRDVEQENVPSFWKLFWSREGTREIPFFFFFFLQIFLSLKISCIIFIDN